MNMISTTGRSPVAAAPTAAPEEPHLGDGGIAHPVPELLGEADGGLEDAFRLRHVLAPDDHRRIARISSRMPAAIA
jgi:hypothetical protein